MAFFNHFNFVSRSLSVRRVSIDKAFKGKVCQWHERISKHLKVGCERGKDKKRFKKN